MTDVAMEDVYAHGAQGLPGCCKPTVAVTHSLSNLFQLKLLRQTTGQCEEQILENNTKKCCMLVSAACSTTSHSNNNSLCNTNELQGELFCAKTWYLHNYVKKLIIFTCENITIASVTTIHNKLYFCPSSLYIRTTAQKIKHYMTSWKCKISL